MYVIVIGCGKVGFSLSKALLSTDNEVVVTDRDAHRCELVTDQLGSVVICGDGSEPSGLREAGAGRCDVLIATTGSDGDNLVPCQVAKAYFNVARTIAVVNDPQHLPLFKMLGIDVPISTTDLILSHIEEELPRSSAGACDVTDGREPGGGLCQSARRLSGCGACAS